MLCIGVYLRAVEMWSMGGEYQSLACVASIAILVAGLLALTSLSEEEHAWTADN